MVPFFTLAGNRALEEMRTIIVPPGAALPPGPYGFLEFYCPDFDCDCRRVIFHVIRPDSADKVWATINFGWESPEFYRRWSGDTEMDREMASASLEPFGPQTEHSEDLLRLFRDLLQCDSLYTDRLKRHYLEAKALAKAASASPKRTRTRKNAKRLKSPAKKKRRLRSG